MSRVFLFTFILLGGFSHPAQASSSTQSNPNERIEKLLEIYYLNSKMRTPYDAISIEGNNVKVRVWRDLPPDPNPEKIECLGYQWLLTGRGRHIGEGATAVFKEFPQIDRLSLELVDLEFSTTSENKRGLLKEVVTPKVYLVISVDRAKAAGLSTPARKLKDELNSRLDRCLEIGRSYTSQKEIKL